VRKVQNLSANSNPDGFLGREGAKIVTRPLETYLYPKRQKHLGVSIHNHFGSLLLSFKSSLGKMCAIAHIFPRNKNLSVP
jgi:hypothetical protein